MIPFPAIYAQKRSCRSADHTFRIAVTVRLRARRTMNCKSPGPIRPLCPLTSSCSNLNYFWRVSFFSSSVVMTPPGERKSGTHSPSSMYVSVVMPWSKRRSVSVVARPGKRIEATVRVVTDPVRVIGEPSAFFDEELVARARERKPSSVSDTAKHERRSGVGRGSRCRA